MSSRAVAILPMVTGTVTPHPRRSGDDMVGR